MKRIYLILLTAATLAAGVFSEAQAAQAAPGAELKIGFIDADRINRESVPAERATKKLEKEFAPREQELRRIEGQIKSLQGQLEKDGLTMSDSDRRTKETELGRQTREYQRLQREFREDLNLRRNEEVGKMQRALLQEVQGYAKANGYQLIVSDGVLYAADGVDITPQLVAAIKSKAPAAATPPKP